MFYNTKDYKGWWRRRLMGAWCKRRWSHKLGKIVQGTIHDSLFYIMDARINECVGNQLREEFNNGL